MSTIQLAVHMGVALVLGCGSGPRCRPCVYDQGCLPGSIEQWRGQGEAVGTRSGLSDGARRVAG